MFLLSRLFLMLTESPERAEKARMDAYLADATDLYDLEYRIRMLDRGMYSRSSWMSGR